MNRLSFHAGLLLVGLLGGGSALAQNRVLDHNAIGWYVYTGDHALGNSWELHTEYQWRRIDLLRTWQQSLARVGLHRRLSDNVKVGGGYTYFVTFPFGNYPQAEGNAPYPEHRLHQDLQLSSTYGRVALSQRFRLEQRWLATQANDNPRRIADWAFQHRVRYQIGGEIPLRGHTVDDRELYVNFFDELFIGFGRNVGQNVFNQNRISAGLGYRVRDNIRLELNYLNQILQHAGVDKATGKPIFDANNGFRLNVIGNLDFAGEK